MMRDSRPRSPDGARTRRRDDGPSSRAGGEYNANMQFQQPLQYQPPLQQQQQQQQQQQPQYYEQFHLPQSHQQYPNYQPYQQYQQYQTYSSYQQQPNIPSVAAQNQQPLPNSQRPPSVHSSSSGSSSSYLDISRFQDTSLFGGILGTFFKAPSERVRRHRKKKKRRILLFGNSSSSSVNSDLAYGNGYVRRSKSPRSRATGSTGSRTERPRDSPNPILTPTPRRDKTDEEILAIGRQLSDLARRQNEEDLRNVGKIRPSTLVAGATKISDLRRRKKHGKSRGIGSSKQSISSSSGDDSDWESASEDESSSEDGADSELAYGAGFSQTVAPAVGVGVAAAATAAASVAYRSHGQQASYERKSSVVDPRLFGPVNSLRGMINTPCGFADDRQLNSPRHSNAASEPLPLRNAYPISVTSPHRFENDRASVVSARSELQRENRPAPLPLQQPVPKVPVSSKVYEPERFVNNEPSFSKTYDRERYETREAPSSTKVHELEKVQAPLPRQEHEHKPKAFVTDEEREAIKRSGGWTWGHSGVQAGIATGVTAATAAAVGAAIAEQEDEREEREEWEDWTEEPTPKTPRFPREHRRRKSDKHERDSKHRHRDEDGEKERRRSKRDPKHTSDRDHKRPSKHSDRDDSHRKRKDRETTSSAAPDKVHRHQGEPIQVESNTEKRNSQPEIVPSSNDRRDPRGDQREAPSSSKAGLEETKGQKSLSTSTSIDPFQYQVADDAFMTPQYPTPTRPLTPTVVTVDREPTFDDDSPPRNPDARLSRKDSFEIERMMEDYRNGSRDPRYSDPRNGHDYQEDEHKARSIYEEAKHATVPIAAAAVASAIAVEEERSREKRRRDYSKDGSRDYSRSPKDPVQEEADRYYRESVIARKIATEEYRSRSATPERSVVNKWEDDESPEIITIVTPPEMENKHPEKGLYDAPDADVRIDNKIWPTDEERYRNAAKRGAGVPAFRTRDPSAERDRPVLNLVYPTPVPSRQPTPTPEPKSQETKTREAPSSTSETAATPEVAIGPKGEVIQYAPSAAPKSVTWGENQTRSFDVESPENRSDSETYFRGDSDKPRPKLEKKSPWGILAAAIAGSDSEPVNEPANDVPASDKKAKVQEDHASREVVVDVAPEIHHVDIDHAPPIPGPKPASPLVEQMPGQYADDIEFAATLAAGLKDTGFDPNIVIDDPTYRRRDSPPGSHDANGDSWYDRPTSSGSRETRSTSDSGFVLGEVDTPQEEEIRQRNDWEQSRSLSKRERRELEKLKKQSAEDPSSRVETPVEPSLVEEALDSSKRSSTKEQRKRDKAAEIPSEIIVQEDDYPKDEKVDVEDDRDSKKSRKHRKSRDHEDSRSSSISSRAKAYDDLTSSRDSKPDQDKESKKSKKHRRSREHDESRSSDVSAPRAHNDDDDDDNDYERRSKRRSKHDSGRNDSPARSVAQSEVSVDSASSKRSKRSKRNSGTEDDFYEYGDGPPDFDPFDDRFVSSMLSLAPSEDFRPENRQRRRSSKYDDDDARSIKSVSTAPGSPRRGRDAERKSSGSLFSSIFKSKDKSNDKRDSFLDNADTLGAGVGLAGAAAAMASLSRSNADDAPSNLEHADSESILELEDTAVPDPEIAPRVFKIAIDPQYGDLLPLPPSEPGSPASGPEELPALPDSRPGTPPEKRSLQREKLTHHRRRSAQETPLKSPSQTAIPIQLRLGQRSVPSSPIPHKASPANSPDTPRRPRPTSWESSREFKPLYLLEHARHSANIEPSAEELELPALPPSEASEASEASDPPSRSESPGFAGEPWTQDADYFGPGLEHVDFSSDPALRIDTNIPLVTPDAGDEVGSEQSTPRAEIKPEFPEMSQPEVADEPITDVQEPPVTTIEPEIREKKGDEQDKELLASPEKKPDEQQEARSVIIEEPVTLEPQIGKPQTGETQVNAPETSEPEIGESQTREPETHFDPTVEVDTLDKEAELPTTVEPEIVAHEESEEYPIVPEPVVVERAVDEPEAEAERPITPDIYKDTYHQGNETFKEEPQNTTSSEAKAGEIEAEASDEESSPRTGTEPWLIEGDIEPPTYAEPESYWHRADERVLELPTIPEDEPYEHHTELPSGTDFEHAEQEMWLPTIMEEEEPETPAAVEKEPTAHWTSEPEIPTVVEHEPEQHWPSEPEPVARQIPKTGELEPEPVEATSKERSSWLLYSNPSSAQNSEVGVTVPLKEKDVVETVPEVADDLASLDESITDANEAQPETHNPDEDDLDESPQTPTFKNPPNVLRNPFAKFGPGNFWRSLYGNTQRGGPSEPAASESITEPEPEIEPTPEPQPAPEPIAEPELRSKSPAVEELDEVKPNTDFENTPVPEPAPKPEETETLDDEFAGMSAKERKKARKARKKKELQLSLEKSAGDHVAVIEPNPSAVDEDKVEKSQGTAVGEKQNNVPSLPQELPVGEEVAQSIDKDPTEPKALPSFESAPQSTEEPSSVSQPAEAERTPIELSDDKKETVDTIISSEPEAQLAVETATTPTTTEPLIEPAPQPAIEPIIDNTNDDPAGEKNDNLAQAETSKDVTELPKSDDVSNAADATSQQGDLPVEETEAVPDPEAEETTKAPKLSKKERRRLKKALQTESNLRDAPDHDKPTTPVPEEDSTLAVDLNEKPSIEEPLVEADVAKDPSPVTAEEPIVDAITTPVPESESEPRTVTEPSITLEGETGTVDTEPSSTLVESEREIKPVPVAQAPSPTKEAEDRTYFPSSAGLNSNAPKTSDGPVNQGYFPSALRVLPALGSVFKGALRPKDTSVSPETPEKALVSEESQSESQQMPTSEALFSQRDDEVDNTQATTQVEATQNEELPSTPDTQKNLDKEGTADLDTENITKEATFSENADQEPPANPAEALDDAIPEPLTPKKKKKKSKKKQAQSADVKSEATDEAPTFEDPKAEDVEGDANKPQEPRIEEHQIEENPSHEINPEADQPGESSSRPAAEEIVAQEPTFEKSRPSTPTSGMQGETATGFYPSETEETPAISAPTSPTTSKKSKKKKKRDKAGSDAGPETPRDLTAEQAEPALLERGLPDLEKSEDSPSVVAEVGAEPHIGTEASVDVPTKEIAQHETMVEDQHPTEQEALSDKHTKEEPTVVSETPASEDPVIEAMPKAEPTSDIQPSELDLMQPSEASNETPAQVVGREEDHVHQESKGEDAGTATETTLAGTSPPKALPDEVDSGMAAIEAGQEATPTEEPEVLSKKQKKKKRKSLLSNASAEENTVVSPQPTTEKTSEAASTVVESEVATDAAVQATPEPGPDSLVEQPSDAPVEDPVIGTETKTSEEKPTGEAVPEPTINLGTDNVEVESEPAEPTKPTEPVEPVESAEHAESAESAEPAVEVISERISDSLHQMPITAEDELSQPVDDDKKALEPSTAEEIAPEPEAESEMTPKSKKSKKKKKKKSASTDLGDVERNTEMEVPPEETAGLVPDDELVPQTPRDTVVETVPNEENVSHLTEDKAPDAEAIPTPEKNVSADLESHEKETQPGSKPEIENMEEDISHKTSTLEEPETTTEDNKIPDSTEDVESQVPTKKSKKKKKKKAALEEATETDQSKTPIETIADAAEAGQPPELETETEADPQTVRGGLSPTKSNPDVQVNLEAKETESELPQEPENVHTSNPEPQQNPEPEPDEQDSTKIRQPESSITYQQEEHQRELVDAPEAVQESEPSPKIASPVELPLQPQADNTEEVDEYAGLSKKEKKRRKKAKALELETSGTSQATPEHTKESPVTPPAKPEPDERPVPIEPIESTLETGLTAEPEPTLELESAKKDVKDLDAALSEDKGQDSDPKSFGDPENNNEKLQSTQDPLPDVPIVEDVKPVKESGSDVLVRQDEAVEERTLDLTGKLPPDLPTGPILDEAPEIYLVPLPSDSAIALEQETHKQSDEVTDADPSDTLLEQKSPRPAVEFESAVSPVSEPLTGTIPASESKPKTLGSPIQFALEPTMDIDAGSWLDDVDEVIPESNPIVSSRPEAVHEKVSEVASPEEKDEIQPSMGPRDIERGVTAPDDEPAQESRPFETSEDPIPESDHSEPSETIQSIPSQADHDNEGFLPETPIRSGRQEEPNTYDRLQADLPHQSRDDESASLSGEQEVRYTDTVEAKPEAPRDPPAEEVEHPTPADEVRDARSGDMESEQTTVDVPSEVQPEPAPESRLQSPQTKHDESADHSDREKSRGHEALADVILEDSTIPTDEQTNTLPTTMPNVLPESETSQHDTKYSGDSQPLPHSQDTPKELRLDDALSNSDEGGSRDKNEEDSAKDRLEQATDLPDAIKERGPLPSVEVTSGSTQQNDTENSVGGPGEPSQVPQAGANTPSAQVDEPTTSTESQLDHSMQIPLPDSEDEEVDNKSPSRSDSSSNKAISEPRETTPLPFQKDQNIFRRALKAVFSSQSPEVDQTVSDRPDESKESTADLGLGDGSKTESKKGYISENPSSTLPGDSFPQPSQGNVAQDISPTSPTHLKPTEDLQSSTSSGQEVSRRPYLQESQQVSDGKDSTQGDAEDQEASPSPVNPKEDTSEDNINDMQTPTLPDSPIKATSPSEPTVGLETELGGYPDVQRDGSNTSTFPSTNAESRFPAQADESSEQSAHPETNTSVSRQLDGTRQVVNPVSEAGDAKLEGISVSDAPQPPEQDQEAKDKEIELHDNPSPNTPSRIQNEPSSPRFQEAPEQVPIPSTPSETVTSSEDDSSSEMWSEDAIGKRSKKDKKSKKKGKQNKTQRLESDDSSLPPYSEPSKPVDGAPRSDEAAGAPALRSEDGAPNTFFSHLPAENVTLPVSPASETQEDVTSHRPDFLQEAAELNVTSPYQPVQEPTPEPENADSKERTTDSPRNDEPISSDPLKSIEGLSEPPEAETPLSPGSDRVTSPSVGTSNKAKKKPKKDKKKKSNQPPPIGTSFGIGSSARERVASPHEERVSEPTVISMPTATQEITPDPVAQIPDQLDRPSDVPKEADLGETPQVPVKKGKKKHKYPEGIASSGPRADDLAFFSDWVDPSPSHQGSKGSLVSEGADSGKTSTLGGQSEGSSKAIVEKGGKKKKGKGKSKYVDKRQPREEDLFNDDALWESADKKAVEETEPSQQLDPTNSLHQRKILDAQIDDDFWGAGGSDENEDESKETTRGAITQIEDDFMAGGDESEEENKGAVTQLEDDFMAGGNDTKEETKDTDTKMEDMPGKNDEKQHEAEATSNCGMELDEPSADKKTEKATQLEPAWKAVPQQPVSSDDVFVESPVLGRPETELAQQKPMGLLRKGSNIEQPSGSLLREDSQAITLLGETGSTFGDLRRSPSPALTTVEEIPDAEAEQGKDSWVDSEAPRDSGIVTGSPRPRGRQENTSDDNQQRDSGIATDDYESAAQRLKTPEPPPELRRALRRSPRAAHYLREPSSQRATPEPEKTRKTYGSLVGANPAGASGATTPSSRSVSDNPQSPRPEAGGRRSMSNTSFTRYRTPEPALRGRPESPGINRPSGTPTPPLRRADRRMSGDLRALRQHNTTTPVANEGRVRTKDMADVYDGFGEGRLGSPRSPTRPHSMRRRQSMQVLELENKVEQLMAENRLLGEARAMAETSLSQRAASNLADRDAEIDSLKQSLQFLQKEVTRLSEVNEGLASANAELASKDTGRYTELENRHAGVTRELDEARSTQDQYKQTMEEKDAEIANLRQQLDAAKEKIQEMQRQILETKASDEHFLNIRDEDYFDHRCQQLCSHVQQWVLRFSKFSDMRACRLTSEINDEKTIDRLDNAVLDGSDVDRFLKDRVKRRDIFMSMTMNMVWEFIFTRYLFGMDREQRQKLKSLEKLLTEVGPSEAVRSWRAVTLTLLSKRDGFKRQRDLDTEAVVQAIFQTLCKILPPPSNLEDQIQSQLRRVMRAAVELSIEMRTQKAEYMMLPPLQPEYDADGELTATVQFNAQMMNERSGSSTLTNEDLQAQGAVVRVVLFPLVVKKGDDNGVGDVEIVVCPAQVLVARPRGKYPTPASDAGSASADGRSHVSAIPTGGESSI